jgi:phosphoribosyl-ATP pyrophosphohydrolase
MGTTTDAADQPNHQQKPHASVQTHARTRSHDGAEPVCRSRFCLSESTSAYTLHDLAARVHERAQASAETSYTRKLLDKGVAQCAKKLGEEAVETVIAAIAEDRAHLIAEAADLLYHLLVVLEARGVALGEVEAALALRTGLSGLAEKASRPRD